MRFEVLAAYGLGVAAPILESIRRHGDDSTIAFYVDDFLMGGALLWAAVAVTRGARYGDRLLAGAWGMLAAGMYGSFFGQIEWMQREGGVDVSGYSHSFVIGVKGVMFALAVVGFVMAVRRGESRATVRNQDSRA